MQPIVDSVIQPFAQQQHIEIAAETAPSREIAAQLRDDSGPDAALVSNSLWLDGVSTSETHNLMRLPIVLAINKGAARDAGWLDAAGNPKRVSMRDVIAANTAGTIRIMMANPEKSGAGYLTFLSIVDGLAKVKPGFSLTQSDLDRPEVARDAVMFLRKATAIADSSKELRENLRASRGFDGGFLYEPEAIALNKELAAAQRSPYVFIYPSDTPVVTQSLMAFVKRPEQNPAIKQAYEQLATFLASPEAHQKIAALGWRMSESSEETDLHNAQVFRSGWGIQPSANLDKVTIPSSRDVTEKLIGFYAHCRKPQSVLIYIVDYSAALGGSDQDGRALSELMIDTVGAGIDKYQSDPNRWALDSAYVISMTDGAQTIGSWSGKNETEIERMLRQMRKLKPRGTANFQAALQASINLIKLHPGCEPTVEIIYADGPIAHSDGPLEEALRNRSLTDSINLEVVSLRGNQDALRVAESVATKLTGRNLQRDPNEESTGN